MEYSDTVFIFKDADANAIWFYKQQQHRPKSLHAFWHRIHWNEQSFTATALLFCESVILCLSDCPPEARLKDNCLRGAMYHQVINSLVGRGSLKHSLPLASLWSSLSCNKVVRLPCRTWVTFSGALMLNTAYWCHCWKLSELTVLSRAGPHIYILYSSSLQTFNLAPILNPFSVNLPKSTER